MKIYGQIFTLTAKNVTVHKFQLEEWEAKERWDPYREVAENFYLYSRGTIKLGYVPAIKDHLINIIGSNKIYELEVLDGEILTASVFKTIDEIVQARMKEERTLEDKLDIDIIMTGKPKSLRDKLSVILGLISSMENETGMVEKSTLLERLQTEHDILPKEAERFIGQMLKEGTLFYARDGFLKKT